MTIKKAVITAAARGGRLYPVGDTVQKAMLPIADLDGVHKPVLQIIAEEGFASGIQEICIICAPGDEKRYKEAFTTLRDNLHESYGGVDWAKEQAKKITHLLEHLQFIVQEETLGYGHAVWCAKDFVANDPFLLLLGDHLYISDVAERCAEQIINLAKDEKCSVAAVNSTPEHMIHQYGTIAGRHLAGNANIYEIENIIEKPSLSVAELQLMTPGLRAGQYLCFFGMHVLEADIFSILEKQIDQNHKHIPLTPALQELNNAKKYIALEVKGRRYNLGTRYGWLESQIAFALQSPHKDSLLSSIVNQLAEAQQRKS